MSRVLTFSRTYPGYHPKAGESTHFIEKFWASIGNPGKEFTDLFIWPDNWLDQQFDPKHHTIRAGRKWKAGDWFSPRVWSGKPYNSKQIQFAPDTQVVKTWDVEVDEVDVWAIGEPGKQVYYIEEDAQNRIAKNDGLTEADLYFWFKQAKKPFVGQVICWNTNVEY